MRKRDVYIGVDLSLSDDITATCFAWPRMRGESSKDWPRLYVTHKYYLPEDLVYERERETRVPLRLWAEQGYIHLTEGDVVDHSVVREHISGLAKHAKIRRIAFDPAFGIETMTILMGQGLPVEKFAQSRNNMSAALKEVTDMIKRGDVQHEGNPVTRWHVGNTQVKTDSGGRIYPIKAEGSGRRNGQRRHKIDGVFAMLMAAHVAMADEVMQGSALRTRTELDYAAG